MLGENDWTGVPTLCTGVPKLSTGVPTLCTGVPKLSTGVSKLCTGATDRVEEPTGADWKTGAAAREEEPIADGTDWRTGAAERDPDWALATDASIRNAAAMARLNLKFI